MQACASWAEQKPADAWSGPAASQLQMLILGENEVDKWLEGAQPAAGGAGTVQSGQPR